MCCVVNVWVRFFFTPIGFWISYRRSSFFSSSLVQLLLAHIQSQAYNRASYVYGTQTKKNVAEKRRKKSRHSHTTNNSSRQHEYESRTEWETHTCGETTTWREAEKTLRGPKTIFSIISRVFALWWLTHLFDASRFFSQSTIADIFSWVWFFEHTAATLTELPEYISGVFETTDHSKHTKQKNRNL